MEIKIKHIFWAILFGLYLWGYKFDLQEPTYIFLKVLWIGVSTVLVMIACILGIALPIEYIKEKGINGDTKLFKIKLWKKEK